MNLALLTDELIDKLESHCILSENDIVNYLNVLMNFLEIQPYIKNITFSDKKKTSYATYNFTTKEIKMYYEFLKKDAKVIAKDLSLSENLLIILNSLLSLYHEVYHAIENNLIDIYDWPILNVMNHEINFSAKKPILFNKLYPYSVFEREAMATSLESVLLICKEQLHDGRLYNFYKVRLINTILNGYDIDSKGNVYKYPMKIMQKYHVYEGITIDGDLSIYDLLRLGSKVTSEELKDYLYNSSTYIDKRLDLISQKKLTQKNKG